MIHYNKETDKTQKPLNDTYYTNPETVELCLLALDKATLFTEAEEINILDPGCGKGAWGTAARRLLNQKEWSTSPGSQRITGVDLAPVGDLAGYDRVVQEDYLTWELDAKEQAATGGQYDLVIGNPPYGRRALLPFVEKSLALCKEGGYVAFLLRMEFLEGQRRGRGFWFEHCLRKVWVLSDRACFNGQQKSYPGFFGLFLWEKFDQAITERSVARMTGVAPDFRATWLHKDLPYYQERMKRE